MNSGEKAFNVMAGSRLRAARRLRGLSQAEFGRALGVSFQQIQKYERGINALSAAKLVRSAEILGIMVGISMTSAMRPLRRRAAG